jgi:hypothetical protein
VGPGSEVVVLPGHYTVSAPLSSLNTADIHGLDGQPRPTISSTYAFAAWSLGSGTANMTFRHIEIETTGLSGVMISGNGTSSVEDVVITATGAGGSGCAASVTGGGTVTFKNSICRGANRGLGSNCNGCNQTVNVRNVTAIGETYGLAFGSSPGSATDATVTATNVIARHNGSSGSDVSAIAGSTNSDINISLTNSNYATRETTLCPTLPCTATVTDPTANNNQTTAPVFANAAGGDFHQATGSPTVNAGANDAQNGSADIDAQNRTIDGTTDIGADELGLATTMALTCAPAALVLPSSSVCTATATDPSVSAVAPSGVVAFGSASAGSFSPGTSCTLAPVDSNSASCSVTYTPTVPGSHGLSATSSRDLTHEGSTAGTSISAASPAPAPAPAATTTGTSFNLTAAIKRCKKKFPKGPKRKRCIRKARARARS